jgi:hypothetical protein
MLARNRPHTSTRTRANAHTHTHTHTHARARTHAHTHTHAPVQLAAHEVKGEGRQLLQPHDRHLGRLALALSLSVELIEDLWW